LYLELSLLLEDEIGEEDLNIVLANNEIKVTLSNELLYDVGSAELYPKGMDVLERIASRIALVEEEEFFVDVEGHTDNRPVIGGRYESNWDLSTARSSNVVEVLLNKGFSPRRIRASGYADAKPLVPNIDQFGNPIEDNQAKNRRFELRMYMN
jgi:chemotaxis protein MotB